VEEIIVVVVVVHEINGNQVKFDKEGRKEGELFHWDALIEARFLSLYIVE